MTIPFQDVCETAIQTCGLLMSVFPGCLENKHDIDLIIPYKSTLPAQVKQYSMYLILFLRDGVSPTSVGTSLSMFLHESFDYLGNIPLSSKYISTNKLNLFTREDKQINESKSLIPLYDYQTRCLIGIERKTTRYPFVLPPKHSKIVCSPRLSILHERLTNCSKCNRRSFFTVLLNRYSKCLCIAGGILHRTFIRSKVPDCPQNDTDIFLYGIENEQKIHAIITDIWDLYRSQFSSVQSVLFRTSCAVTMFQPTYSHRNVIQIILRRYDSMENILQSFDLDSSCLLYNGKMMYVNKRGLRFLQTNANYVDVNRQSNTFIKRLFKYYKQYHVNVVLPNFDYTRISLEVLSNHELAQKDKGLLNLLKTYLKGVNKSSTSYTKIPWINSITSINRLNRFLYFLPGKRSFSIRFGVNDRIFESCPLEESQCTLTMNVLMAPQSSFTPLEHQFYHAAYTGEYHDSAMDTTDRKGQNDRKEKKDDTNGEATTIDMTNKCISLGSGYNCYVIRVSDNIYDVEIRTSQRVAALG